MAWVFSILAWVYSTTLRSFHKPTPIRHKVTPIFPHILIRKKCGFYSAKRNVAVNVTVTATNFPCCYYMNSKLARSVGERSFRESICHIPLQDSLFEIPKLDKLSLRDL